MKNISLRDKKQTMGQSSFLWGGGDVFRSYFLTEDSSYTFSSKGNVYSWMNEWS